MKSTGKPEEQDGGGRIDQQPGTEAANLMELQLAISSQAMDVEVAIPELSQTEMEARMRAVTMVEVDNPQLPPLDDWATPTPTEDGLPTVTVDMFGAEGLLSEVNQEQDLVSLLQDDGEISAMLPPPPVRPISASDPHVEVTPTVGEEKKKRSPRQPAEDIANPGPGDIEDVNPPNIVVEPPPVDEEVPAQRKRRSSRIADLSTEEAQPSERPEDNAIIQPPAAAEELPASFELPEVTAKPPKKKRKVSRLLMDGVTMLSGATIKAQLDDPGDLLREEMFHPPSFRAKGEEQLISGPGRVIKGVLAGLWQDGVLATNYDWPEESVLEEELSEANPELNPTVTMEQEIPDDVSEIRAAHGAGEAVGEANLSQNENVQASAAAKNILQDLELPSEVSLAVPPLQDLPVFPEVLGAVSPERFPQQDEGPAPPVSPLLAAQLDLQDRLDDSDISRSVLDQIQDILQSGHTGAFANLVESVVPTQPTRKDVAKMFHSLLVLEKKGEIKMDQDKEEEGFYAAITVRI